MLPECYDTDDWFGFVRSIRGQPDDDTIRLAAADYLSDHGDENRATFVRDHVSLSQQGPMPLALDRLRKRRHPPSAFAMRDAVASGRLIGWAEAIIPGTWIQGFDGRRWWELACVVPPRQNSYPLTYRCEASLDRGFFGELRLSAADWLAHGDAVFHREPVTRIVLSDEPPLLVVEAHGEGVRTKATCTLPGRATRGRMHDGEMSWRPLCRRLLAAEWPGIDFVMG